MSTSNRITIARGDGIGPEIMDATLRILEASGAGLEYDEIQIGEQVYLNGNTSGIEDSSWDTLRRNGLFLKSPITTPQGGGYKSLNVTIRKSLGLFANVRPVLSYNPFVKSNFDKLDMVVVRENEEDLYAGIEHQQTQEVVQTLKLISRPGSERIIRYAFEFARAYGRKKVTCMSKDNIMKQTDGMFHRIFDEVAKEYPEIEKDHLIIDIGSAIVANRPETLDVVVTLNLYGDIISDIAAEISGSVGLGGSSNVGQQVAMFEAIHGSAPDIAGKNMANPSGLLNAANMMLVQMGKSDIAEKIQNAWLKTLEDGFHTGDIFQEGMSKERVGTKEFAQAIIDRLGQTPTTLSPAKFGSEGKIDVVLQDAPKKEKLVTGMDIFIDWDEDNRDPEVLGNKLINASTEALKLKMITNRGVKVFPNGLPETFCTDHWRCRFIPRTEGASISHAELRELLHSVEDEGLDWIKVEQLCTFDGERAYSLGQGE
jgi:isocitrate dehydrogenase